MSGVGRAAFPRCALPAWARVCSPQLLRRHRGSERCQARRAVTAVHTPRVACGSCVPRTTRDPTLPAAMSRVMVDDSRRDAVFRKLRTKAGNKVRPVHARRKLCAGAVVPVSRVAPPLGLPPMLFVLNRHAFTARAFSAHGLVVCSTASTAARATRLGRRRRSVCSCA